MPICMPQRTIPRLFLGYANPFTLTRLPARNIIAVKLFLRPFRTLALTRSDIGSVSAVLPTKPQEVPPCLHSNRSEK